MPRSPADCLEAVVCRWEATGELPTGGKAAPRQGRGKTTIFLDESTVLQIRAVQPWYEPVEEAHAAWARTGCPVPELLVAGATKSHVFYLFRRAPGIVLAEALATANAVRAHTVLEAYGRAVASLCEVRSTRFGEFTEGLTGRGDDWWSFLCNRAHTYLPAVRPLVGETTAREVKQFWDTAPRTDVEPHVVYVDVSMTNALWDVSSGHLTVIDHDYLISGDPAFALARFWAVTLQDEWFTSFARGFGPLPAEVAWRAYRMLHLLELLSVPRQPGRPMEISAARLRTKLHHLLAEAPGRSSETLDTTRRR
jgi:aminoglycoside phosphotransferase (APT) family kinase protein